MATLQHHVHQAPPPQESRTGAESVDADRRTSSTPHALEEPPQLGGRTVSPRSHSPPNADMASVSWHMDDPTSQVVVPTFPNKATGNPVVIASSGIRVEAPAFSAGTSSSNASKQLDSSAPATAAARRAAAGGGDGDESEAKGGGLNQRRQKRLERNRESARLSRRRRKQYLEVLEERVTELSTEMDLGRRKHVTEAIDTIKKKRQQILQGGDESSAHLLTTVLSRTSNELRVASTFQYQQLQSLSLPAQAKFLLWLSLQNDMYFRGGRAPSERLSAARIGERMLSSGNDKVPPCHGMWPLFCHEVGLSYDQEERLRNFQNVLLQDHDAWVHRHTAAASKLAMDSAHDCLQAAHHAVGQRERSVLGVLNESQRLKFLNWASKNADKLARLNQKRLERTPVVKQEQPDDGVPDLSPNHHIAANLYILNHRLQKVLQKIPRAPPLVVGSKLKLLSRRPSFESLGSSSSLQDQQSSKGDARPISRETSFSSSGSLKRSSSEISVDGMAMVDEERPSIPNVNPEEAQAAAAPALEAALGFIKQLLPPPKPISTMVVPEPVTSYSMPPPPNKQPSTMSYQQAPRHVHPYNMATTAMQNQGMSPMPQPQVPLSNPEDMSPIPVAVSYGDDMQNIPSFLPPDLNVVPEEGFLPVQGAEMSDADFLFDLTESDWAIGGGFDMETA